MVSNALQETCFITGDERDRQAWSTHLVSACVWLVHGIRQRDPAIYFACISWIALDAAIVTEVLVFASG